MSNLTVAASFTKNSGDDPATGLALADIDLSLTSISKATGALSAIWNTQNPTAEVTNLGTYIRIYDSADFDLFDYIAGGAYTGADALDADWVVGMATEDNESIWAYARRTLTVPASSGEEPTGSNIAILRGDTWSVDIEGLGDISARAKLWFTVKKRRSDVDSESIIQIEETAGLVYLNGEDASARAANGSITVTDAAAGNITIKLDEAETAILIHDDGLPYDVQMLDTDADVTTLTIAAASVTDDVTRAIT